MPVTLNVLLPINSPVDSTGPKVRFEMVASMSTATVESMAIVTLYCFAGVLFGTSAGDQLFGSL